MLAVIDINVSTGPSNIIIDHFVALSFSWLYNKPNPNPAAPKPNANKYGKAVALITALCR
ncbi:MAG: hypothetical protein QW046_04465 [Candidatus Micrarchaeaceae archaeon]